MKYATCAILLVLLVSGSTVAQVPQQLHFVVASPKPHPKLIILSEVHAIKQSRVYKRALIKRLYDSFNVRDIVWEASKSIAYLCNQYIQSGDTSVLNILYPNPRDTAAREGGLKTLRQWYIEGRKLEIHGIDFEWPTFLEAIRYICKKKKTTDNDLYRYVVSLPDTIQRLNEHDRMWRERRTLYNDCKKIYKDNPGYYDGIIDGSFSIKDIFNNPASESNFAGRDAAMAKNMASVLDAASGNVFLNVGSYHIENPGKLYRKLVGGSRLARNDIMVISMLCKDCISGGLYFSMKKHGYAGNKSLLADTATADKIFAKYGSGNQLNIVAADDNFYKEFPSQRPEHIDYIMIINCTEK